jgi:glutathione peroxidase
MTNRRAIITAALAAIASPAAARRALAQAAVSRVTAYAFSFPALAGGDIRLADYAGRPLMIVNTASLCVVSRRNMRDCSNCGPSSMIAA